LNSNRSLISRLIFLMIFGYRIDAIRIIGQEVMLPRGLVGLAIDTMDQAGEAMAEALRVFIEPGVSGSGILVHCTQGKDRTGIIIAMVLMILDVPPEAISHDYLLTQKALVTDREARVAEIREIGLTPEWGDCAPDFVEKVKGHLVNKYGGVDAYLETIGFNASEKARLVETLGA
jgi:protein-tyrosine phosphatase